MSRMFDVIVEAVRADYFQIVAFDHRQRPFYQQLKGNSSVIEEMEKLSLVNKAISAQKPVLSCANHNQGIQALCFPFVFKGKPYGYAYLERLQDSQSFTEQEIDILSSALPLIKIISQGASPAEEIKIKSPQDELEFLGLSQPFRVIRELIEKVKNVNSPVLITGESGTGKELIAKIIHHSGLRSAGQFVAVNCSAIPENLLESELFGYSRGSFTGALRDRPGLVEEAHNGTFFLDEIGDLSLSLQAKLLRVLQEKEIRRIGENRNRRVDVRFISATNKNLEQEVAAGRFRQDLYFRLKIIVFEVPPLRQRPEDILVLINHFLDRYCQEMNRDRAFFSPEALELLLKYEWPGNVRELQNEIQRCLVLSSGQRIIEEEILSPAIRKAHSQPYKDSWDYSQAKAEFEKKFLSEALQYFNYHRARTAAAIGLTRQGLFRLLKKYGLDRMKN